jgi:hypothetical protein
MGIGIAAAIGANVPASRTNSEKLAMSRRIFGNYCLVIPTLRKPGRLRVVSIGQISGSYNPPVRR